MIPFYINRDMENLFLFQSLNSVSLIKTKHLYKGNDFWICYMRCDCGSPTCGT